MMGKTSAIVLAAPHVGSLLSPAGRAVAYAAEAMILENESRRQKSRAAKAKNTIARKMLRERNAPDIDEGS